MDVGTVLQQCLNDVKLSMKDCRGESVEAIAVYCVHVGSMLQKHLQCFHSTCRGYVGMHACMHGHMHAIVRE